ncbi:MAG: hypothetical protein Q9191_006302 [Dirinaria sp. TL-2023a]
MRLLTTLLPIFLASFAASKSFAFFGGDQKVLNEELSVPGANPLEFCQSNDNYSLNITYVDLTPNPPTPGTVLTIEAKGNFTKKVEEGAYVELSIKYGLIRIINTSVDLCAQLKEIDEECPVEGPKTITKTVQLPKEIPPGKYTVLADVFTKDKDKITCLQAQITF